MPKTPIDYSKTIIYKIEHNDDDNLVYVGHTTCWDKRKCKHKNACNNEKDKKHNYKLYQMMRENGGWDMFRMIEVEKYSCNDKREAEKRENEVMKELKATMNMKPSYVSEEEKKDKDKKYYEKNQKRIQDYYQNNKKHKIERAKNYREINKEIIKEKRNEIISCECGCEIAKTNLKRHQATKKHIDLIKNKI